MLDKVKGLLDSTLDSEDFLTAEEDELDDVDDGGRIDDDDDDFHDALEELPDDKGDVPKKKHQKKKVSKTDQINLVT